MAPASTSGGSGAARRASASQDAEREASEAEVPPSEGASEEDSEGAPEVGAEAASAAMGAVSEGVPAASGTTSEQVASEQAAVVARALSEAGVPAAFWGSGSSAATISSSASYWRGARRPSFSKSSWRRSSERNSSRSENQVSLRGRNSPAANSSSELPLGFIRAGSATRITSPSEHM